MRVADGTEIAGVLADASLSVGAAVVAGIRPEKMRVNPGNMDSLADHYKAQIREVVYSGDVIRYHMGGPGHGELLVTAPAASTLPSSG